MNAERAAREQVVESAAVAFLAHAAERNQAAAAVELAEVKMGGQLSTMIANGETAERAAELVGLSPSETRRLSRLAGSTSTCTSDIEPAALLDPA
jgi:hypothetical protein